MKSLPKILLLAAALGTAPQVLAARLELGGFVHQVTGSAIINAGDERKLVPTQSNGPTLPEAVEMVKRQYKGRIVSAETRTNGGREVHYIKVLTQDGKVKTVKIPGRSQQP